MSYQPKSVWRCDRCAKEEALQRDERPSGWAKFKLNGIDEQLDGSHAPERHLCGECVDAWQNYMQAAPR
jgi:polyferredoxin